MGNIWKKTQGYNRSALLFDPTIEKIKPLHGLSLQMGCILYSDIYSKSNHNMGKGSKLCTPKIDQNLAQKPKAIHVVGLILRTMIFVSELFKRLLVNTCNIYVTREFLFIFKQIPGTGAQIICAPLTARGSTRQLPL